MRSFLACCIYDTGRAYPSRASSTALIEMRDQARAAFAEGEIGIMHLARGRASRLPILDPQPRHAAKFPDVARHQDHISRNGLACDQHVVGSDRRAS